MNHSEAAVLCRYVRAVCPQQAIDEFTPDAWADLLGGIRLVDAKQAVRTITARQPFVAPAEIITEVKRIRNDRITRADHPIPPADLDPAEAKAWLCDARRRIGDGDQADTTARGELHTRPVAELVATAASHLAGESR